MPLKRSLFESFESEAKKNNEFIESNTKNKMEDVCPICLDPLSDGSPVCMLRPCTHMFHCSCISKNKEYESRCPMCRSDIEEITKKLNFGKKKRSLGVREINALIFRLKTIK